MQAGAAQAQKGKTSVCPCRCHAIVLPFAFCRAKVRERGEENSSCAFFSEMNHVGGAVAHGEGNRRTVGQMNCLPEKSASSPGWDGKWGGVGWG